MSLCGGTADCRFPDCAARFGVCRVGVLSTTAGGGATTVVSARADGRDGSAGSVPAPVPCQGLSHQAAPTAPTSTTPAATAGHTRRPPCSAAVTVIVAVALVFSCVAVTVAIPGPIAVARPLEDTVITSVLVDAHVMP